MSKSTIIIHTSAPTKKASRGKYYHNWGPSNALCDRWDAELAQERAALAAKKEEVKKNNAAK